MDIAFIIIINITISIISYKNIYLLLYSNSITLKINSYRNVRIFGDMQYCLEDCPSEPDEMYINGNNKITFSPICDFDEIPQFITLVWKNSDILFTTTMFMRCSAITEIDLSNFDTSHVTNMILMFGGCSSLKSINLSNFNTSQVTSMNYMFNSCKQLTSLNLSSFDTRKVEFMNGMFANCILLGSLDLSNFITPKIKSLVGMFQGCSALTSLDISSFNLDKVESIVNFIEDCSKLEYFKIKIGDNSDGLFNLYNTALDDLVICCNIFDGEIFWNYDKD